MLVKVVTVQAQMGQELSLEEKLHIFRQRPDLVCLPEYYTIDGAISDFHRAAIQAPDHFSYLRRLSSELDTCLIGGSIVEASEESLYNTSYLFDRGRVLGRYRKINPVSGELKGGIVPGQDYLVAEIRGVRVGVLLCGDVFHSSNYKAMATLEADVVFVPTTSPYRPADSLTQKRTRDYKYYVSGAMEAGAYIVKVCGVGRLFGKPLQGRSLIAAPWKILTRVKVGSENSRRVLSSTLDIDEIRDFRERLSLRHYRRELADRCPR